MLQFCGSAQQTDRPPNVVDGHCRHAKMPAAELHASTEPGDVRRGVRVLLTRTACGATTVRPAAGDSKPAYSCPRTVPA